MNLSPLSLARLRVNAESAIPVENTTSDLAKYKRYMCAVCDELHKQESDADYCCPRESKEVWVHPKSGHTFDCEESLHDDMLGEAEEVCCPICLNVCQSTHDAANCCLWKDLDAPTRWRIADAVEAGSTWAKELEIT